MNFTIFSDESGDLGVPYNEKSTNNYILSACCIYDWQENISKIRDIAFFASKKHLGVPLQEWKKLSGKLKNDNIKLSNFINELNAELRKEEIFFTLSSYIYDKERIVTFKSKEKDKHILKKEANEGYLKLLKRIVPFIKKYHYHAGLYSSIPKPTIEWFIDINNEEFKNTQEKNAKQISEEYNINIKGPKFVSKKSNDRDLVHMIALTDIIGGIISKSFAYFQNCQSQCPANNCWDFKDCSNNFLEPWKSIYKLSKDQKIFVNDNKIWDWEGIFYSPIDSLNHVSRFIGHDKFINSTNR